MSICSLYSYPLFFIIIFFGREIEFQLYTVNGEFAMFLVVSGVNSFNLFFIGRRNILCYPRLR